MTNMDDQIARHVRDMILRITQKDAQGRQQPDKARDTLHRAARLLRGRPASSRGLKSPATHKSDTGCHASCEIVRCWCWASTKRLVSACPGRGRSTDSLPSSSTSDLSQVMGRREGTVPVSPIQCKVAVRLNEWRRLPSGHSISSRHPLQSSLAPPFSCRNSAIARLASAFAFSRSATSIPVSSEMTSEPFTRWK
jgi:hypothetical protein